MLVETPIHTGTPNFSVNSNKLLEWVEMSYVQMLQYIQPLPPFLSNEKHYVQEIVAELDRGLRNLEIPLCIQREYFDIYNENANTRRSVDFYFYSSEQGCSRKSIFSVEAKRLPTPGNERQREYVIGQNRDGGIERFKLEEHGKELNNCGMLAIIEKENFDYWFNTINSWINDLIENNSWSLEERLVNLEQNNTWAKAFSIVNRENDKLKLYHFWIIIN